MTSIADRKHRATVCSMKDVVTDADGMRLYRKGIYQGWAAIEPKKASRFSAQGYAIQEPTDKVTHVVTMNYRSDISITAAAWLYEARLKSAPRWFKIVNVVEKGEFWAFECRLVEASDEAVAPVEAVPEKAGIAHLPLPEGVKL